MVLFKNQAKKFLDKYKEMLNNLEKSIPLINAKTDLEKFKQETNYVNENKRRFLKEEFLDYELLKKSIEQNEVIGEDDENSNNIYFESNSISMKNIILKYNINIIKYNKICILSKLLFDSAVSPMI